MLLAAVALGLTAPGQTLGVSVFVDPIIAGLDLTRSQVSGAYLVGTLTGALALPRVGRLIDRHGIRLTMTVVATLFAVVLAAMSQVAGLLTLGLGFVGIRMLGQGSLNLTATTSVAVAFDRGRGAAIGLTTAAGQALMSAAPLVLSLVIGGVGWRATWLVAAATVAVVVVPVGWFGMRGFGLEVGRAEVARRRQAEGVVAPGGWTRREAARTLMLWVVAGAVTATGLIGTGLSFHQISILGEQGLTPAEAAANFLPQTAAGLVAVLAMGALVDRVPPRVLVGAAMTTLAAAMVGVRFVAPGWSAALFGAGIGAAGGSMRALEAAALPAYFGTAHIGAIRGLVMTINVAATAFGPLALALGFSQFGSYGPALTVLLVLPVGVGVTALFATPPSPDQRPPSGRTPAHAAAAPDPEHDCVHHEGHHP